MPAFSYQGFDQAGKAISGRVSVSNLDELENLLARQNIILTAATLLKSSISSNSRQEKVVSQSATTLKSPSRKRKVSDAMAADILSNLATMCKAGVPFVESLEAVLAIYDKPVIVENIRQVRDRIVSGASLSEAMAGAKDLFPDMVAEMLHVAESGGKLEVALFNSANYLARSADLRRKVINAMLYPMVMLAVSSMVVAAMIVFVLPKFGDVFTKMHAEIPPITRMMLNAGVAFNSHPLASIFIILVSLVALVLVGRSELGNALVGAIVAKTPGLGDLVMKLALSRSLQSISVLLLSNVSLVDALAHGAKVSGSQSLEQALNRTVGMVQEGSTLSSACAETKAFPAMVVQIIGVGERTGQLGSMLGTCAEKLERETDERLKSLVSILEPLMIVVMGVVIGAITMSIVTPIYSTIQNIH